MKVLCVIPARYASTRLPGKPLALIAGKPMIQHVYERACHAVLPQRWQHLAHDQVLALTGHSYRRMELQSPSRQGGIR